MQNTLRILALFLLLFLGFGAVYGALMLISDPSGRKFEWSLELLNGTPFNTYLIPGIILLAANGLLPIYIAVFTFTRRSYAHAFILLQGVIVIIWLTVQLLMNPDFFLPITHYPSYGVGVLLVIIGALGLRYNKHHLI